MLSLILSSVLISVAVCDKSDQLLSVVVIYRHGDRTPIDPYPTDPYKNASYWPVGFGQLTNIGKLQHYQLGKWLRARYDFFLPDLYSEKDFYIRSTDSDRTLMSAASNLASLYPPIGNEIWNPHLLWQPIPIHSTPEEEDSLLAMKKDCPKYNLLLDELFKTEYFMNISQENHELYTYLTRNAGTRIASLKEMEYLYNTLFIEDLYNFTLPEWTKTVYPDSMRPWAELSFATSCYTKALARLKSGTLFNEIIQHFVNATTVNNDYRKFLTFSAHDTTIGNVLTSIEAFQPHCPPYASTILLELRQSKDNYYVNIFYKNSSHLQNITLSGCQFDCNLTDFIELLKPIAITQEEWEIECQLGWYYYFHIDNLQYVIILSTFTSILLIIMLAVLIAKCYRKLPKEGAPVYTQLPSDEMA